MPAVKTPNIKLVATWISSTLLMVATVAAHAQIEPVVVNSNAIGDSMQDWNPSLAIDGAGHIVAVWQSQDTLAGTIGSDGDILISRSFDFGQTWTSAAALNSYASTDSTGDYYPKVVTDGNGTWIATWSSQNTLGGTIGFDGDILFSRSTDNGQTWSAAAALNANATSDSGSDGQVEVAADGAGNWLAVWVSSDTLGGTIGADLDILVARSTNDGLTWTVPAALNTNAGGDAGEDARPHIATDGLGQWVATWDTRDEFDVPALTDRNVFVSRSSDLGATWTPPFEVSADVSDIDIDDYSDVATDGNTWIVAWRHADASVQPGGVEDNDIMMSRSTDGGATWSNPSPLNTTATNDINISDIDVSLSVDGFGNWVASWSCAGGLAGSLGNDYDIVSAISLDQGVNWTDPYPLHSNAATDAQNDLVPVLAVDKTFGIWVAAWYSFEDVNGQIGNDGDILAVVWQLTDDIDFDGLSNGDEINIHNTDPFDSDTDDDGVNDGYEIDTLSTNPLDEDSDNDGRVDGLENLEGTDPLDAGSLSIFPRDLPMILNTDAASDSRNDFSPQLATDGAGHWVAIWAASVVVGNLGLEYDIMVATSSDNGVTWTAPTALNTNAVTDSGFDEEPQIATDRTGNWVVVWTSNDSLGGTIGTDKDILISRSTNNGASWTPPAALTGEASTDSASDNAPQIITDRGGNWITVWVSNNSLGGTIGNDADILISRSTDNGATWTAAAALNSNAISDNGAASYDIHPQVSADGLGHWVAVWESNTTLGGTPLGTDGDILVARSSDNGLTWTSAAALNTGAASDALHDIQPQVTTDGVGTWLAVWTSGGDMISPPDPDIFVSRSTDNGATWTSSAALNTDATGDSKLDWYPQISTDRSGTWIAVWEDSSNIGASPHYSWVSRSNDTGLTWSAPAVINIDPLGMSGSFGYGDTGHQLVSDESGQWIAIWNGRPLDDDLEIVTTRWFLPTVNLNNLYVNFNAVISGPGTEASPFKKLIDAKVVANNGATIRISPGISSETFVGPAALGKNNHPMTLRRNPTSAGTVRIGKQ